MQVTASNIKFRADMLRSALDRMARDAAAIAAVEIPEDPANHVIAEATRILALCGFAAVHHTKLDDAIGVATSAMAADHESREESERLEELLSYLIQQRRTVAEW